MVIIEAKSTQLQFSDLLSHIQHPYPQSKRSPGIHLSGILRHIALTTGILSHNPSDSNKNRIDEDLEDFPLRMALGMAWEQWIAGMYPDMLWQPGELHLDNVIGSIDGITADYPFPIIEEFKLTYKSSRRRIKEQWLWLAQGKGYCKMYGTNRIRYHVCYVNGDYQGSGPQYYKYLIEFTPIELDRNWEMILKHRDDKEVKVEGEG